MNERTAAKVTRVDSAGRPAQDQHHDQCQRHQQVDTGEGQVLRDLQRITTGGEHAEQQRHHHHQERVVARQPADQKADEAIAG